MNRLLKGIVGMIFDIDKKSDNIIENMRRIHSRIDNIENDMSEFVNAFNKFSDNLNNTTDEIPLLKDNIECSIERLNNEALLIKREIQALQEQYINIFRKYEQGIINDEQFDDENL